MGEVASDLEGVRRRARHRDVEGAGLLWGGPRERGREAQEEGEEERRNIQRQQPNSHRVKCACVFFLDAAFGGY